MGTQQMVRTPQGSGRAGTAVRQDQAAILMEKDAALGRALASPDGIRKIAANMANPVREKLDYKGIARKLAVVEQIPDGVPIIYDRDLPEVPCVIAGIDGNSRITEMKGERIEGKAREFVSRAKVPYSELTERRYRVLERAKDRMVQGQNVKEDLTFFGLLDAANAAAASRSDAPITPVTTGPLDRDFLARGFTEVEKNRNVAMSVLMSPYGTQGIRRLDFQNLDQVGMQEVRETGYLGELWGASFYVSDLVTAGTAYVMVGPKMLAWFAIRKDVDIVPADDPDNVRLGMVLYARMFIAVHNAIGLCPVEFSTTA